MSSYRRDDTEFRARMGELADHVKPAGSTKHTGRVWLVLGLVALGLLCPWLLIVALGVFIISL